MRRSARERKDVEEQETVLSGGKPLTIWATELPTYKTLESVVGAFARSSLLEGLPNLDAEIDDVIQRFFETALRYPASSVEHEVALRCEVYVEGVSRYQVVQERLGTLVSSPEAGKSISLGFRPGGPQKRKRGKSA